MAINYIFTITAGRSGQATLHNIIEKYALNCISAFESPSIESIYLPGFLGNIEKRIRRKYFETNELLGRGKVLSAYENQNYSYIQEVVKKRIKMIEKISSEKKVQTYFDISKFYGRGLYIGFNKLVDNFSIVFLVRDPLLNMKSFLNRNKDFFLDNNSPKSKSNLFKLSIKGLSKGELYLWAWSEMFLRYKKISKSNKVINCQIITNHDLQNVNKISKIFRNLNIKHKNIKNIEKKNTNKLHSGLPETKIEDKDIEILKKFLQKIPTKYLSDLNVLQESLNLHETKNLRRN